MSFLAEIKRRKVFQVAAVYLIVAWLIVQVVDVVNDPLRLPGWFDTVVIVMLAIGFPIAVILAWAFDLTDAGVTRTPSEGGTEPEGARKLEVAFLGLILVGMGWLVIRDTLSADSLLASTNPVPVVVLMDTSAPRGVYSQETRDKSGTNADVLNDILRDLPIVIHKESIGSTWDREDQIIKQQPDLVLIHRSGFFHSMNLELGFGYPDEPTSYDEKRWRRLYDFADNKLMAFFGLVGQGNPNTFFFVYSRGTGGGWPDADYRAGWVADIEGRFPSLSGRIETLAVPGGVTHGNFHNPDAIRVIRQRVQEILGIASGT